MPSSLLRNICSGFQRRLKVVTAFDQLHSQRAHSRILRLTVAVRHHDCRGDTESRRREANRLTMVTASRGNYPLEIRLGAAQMLEVHESAANLECSDRRLILVLHPHGCSATRVQERPALLRRWSHGAIHHPRRRLEVRQLFGHLRSRHCVACRTHIHSSIGASEETEFTTKKRGKRRRTKPTVLAQSARNSQRTNASPWPAFGRPCGRRCDPQIQTAQDLVLLVSVDRTVSCPPVCAAAKRMVAEQVYL